MGTPAKPYHETQDSVPVVLVGEECKVTIEPHCSVALAHPVANCPSLGTVTQDTHTHKPL
jgi:hypothetical protein